MNRTTKVVIAFTLAVILASGAFLGGYVVASLGPSRANLELPSPTESSSRVVANSVEEVDRLLREEALKPPTEASATAAAITGILESNGDKYALYFDARHLKYFTEEMAGQFGGIGVSIGEKNGSAYIVEVFKGTPAARAGFKPGDVFVTIDGVTRAKWSSQEVVKRVRGKQGTKVALTMRRPSAKTYTKTLVRDLIKFPNVIDEVLPGKVGYIRLGEFNELATKELTGAIKRLKGKGATTFVLDLRDNPGGSLDQAVSVASLFLDRGIVVRVDERNKPETEYHTVGSKITDAPLVVLINGDSASASEIVAGALQDHRRAKLVGEKSYGKGSVQTIKQLSFGGAIKFTIAHYLTPNKRVINGKGLTPDAVVKMDRAKQIDRKTDTQLQTAARMARGAAR
jgi:carboxyl-terminal processing protease